MRSVLLAHPLLAFLTLSSSVTGQLHGDLLSSNQFSGFSPDQESHDTLRKPPPSIAAFNFLPQKKKSDQDQTNVETETPPIGNILHSTLKPEEAQKFDQYFSCSSYRLLLLTPFALFSFGREMKEAILKELTMEDYNLRSDYLELILQYGYVTMFAVVFPIAPALAYLNNLMEAKVDFLKLASCRRPPLQDRFVSLSISLFIQ
jgi:hypothetical protein